MNIWRKYLAQVTALLSCLASRRAVVPAAVLAVVLGGFFAWPVQSSYPFTTETMKFTTNVVPGTTNDEEVEIEGTLYVPKGAHVPISAVIIVPSSSGVEEGRETYYAKELAKEGVGALVVDSFKSRGLMDSIYDQSLLDSWEIENDAIAALQELAEDKRFKPDRIAILGVSKGGTAAMNTALSVRRRWMGVDDIAFAAHVPISPDCTWVTRSAKTTRAPIFLMLAEFDDQTPASACLAEAQRMREAGNKLVMTKVYEGAHHAWEELGPKPEYDAEAENYSRCRVWIENDGKMVSADTGEAVPEDDWHSWAKAHCMHLGTHSGGGTAELKEAAMRDIIAFLRKYGF